MEKLEYLAGRYLLLSTVALDGVSDDPEEFLYELDEIIKTFSQIEYRQFNELAVMVDEYIAMRDKLSAGDIDTGFAIFRNIYNEAEDKYM